MAKNFKWEADIPQLNVATIDFRTGLCANSTNGIPMKSVSIEACAYLDTHKSHLLSFLK
jgi:hypothetical protein